MENIDFIILTPNAAILTSYLLNKLQK